MLLTQFNNVVKMKMLRPITFLWGARLLYCFDFLCPLSEQCKVDGVSQLIKDDAPIKEFICK